MSKINRAPLVISTSYGKDSTAMIHLLLEQGADIRKVVYFECEWDFPQMERHICEVERRTGLRTERVRNYRHFNDLLRLYGWPKSAGGWCTACKRDTLAKYVRALRRRVPDIVECIGFTTDELQRSERKGVQKKPWPVRFPLIEAGMGESDCLDYCRNLGYTWGGLYDIYDRVSCFCCPKGGKAKIQKLKQHFPDWLWPRWQELDAIATQAERKAGGGK